MSQGLSKLQKELLHHIYALTLDVENRPADQIDLARHWVPNERSRAAGNTGNTRVWWWNEGLQHALQVGRLLTEEKAKYQHGEWGKALEASFEGSTRTAQTYMQIYRELPPSTGCKSATRCAFELPGGRQAAGRAEG